MMKNIRKFLKDFFTAKNLLEFLGIVALLTGLQFLLEWLLKNRTPMLLSVLGGGAVIAFSIFFYDYARKTSRAKNQNILLFRILAGGGFLLGFWLLNR